MQSGNDETKAAGMAVAAMGAVFWFAFILLFAVAAFATLILTVLCLFAWEREIYLGRYVLGPVEARPFIYRGLAGVLLVWAFIAFCAVVFGIRITNPVWGYAAGVGYVFGSLGVVFWKGLEEAASSANGSTAAALPLAPPSPPPPPAYSLPAPKVQPKPSGEGDPAFRFASWDDEEELRR